MPEANCKSGKYIWAILCISIILLNGCKLFELNQAKSDDTNIKEDKTKEIPPVEQGSGYLSEAPTTGLGIVDEDEELEVLKKVKKLETRLEAERNKVKTFEEKLSKLQTAKEGVERDFADTKKKLEEKNDDMSGKTNALVTKLSDTEAGVVATEQGSGYLSEGSSIGMGVIDGDDEVNVLEKIRRLEARLEAERNKVKTFEEKLSKLQTAKEGVEKDFTDTKKRLENENKDLSDKIKALESELSDTEARAVAAEKELSPVKKELLKSQLSEIKAQQKLYKLKIDNLKQEEE
jgi:chromosome segregation ATPase